MIDVIIASYLEDEHVARIAAARPDIRVCYRPDLLPAPRYTADHTGAPFERSPEAEAEWRRLLDGADVAFDFDYLRPRNMIEHGSKLQWVQGSSSGIGQLLRRHGLDETGIAFTTAAGVHGRPLAEFVLWAALSAAKEYPRARAQQRRRTWQRFHGGELLGSTLLMVGMGGIGRSVAALMRPLGVQVIGTKRDTEGIDPETLGVDQLIAWRDLDTALPLADTVVLACPHTPETHGLVSRERLSLFKRGSLLVNIGRGALVDHSALLEALDDGSVATAVLDVTDPEPLPADHPLWNHERVIVFPHSASTSVRENERLVDLFIDNLGRFAEGRTLRNLYERNRSY